MDDERLFPVLAIQLLQGTRWDPDATCHYEGMSGGLYWSDEFPRAAIEACFSVENWAVRFVLAYRASLVMGQPREELRAPWDQLVKECPDWPGLRAERQGRELRSRLESESIRFLAEIDALTTRQKPTAD